MIETETIELGLQLGVAVALVILLTFIHAVGILGISRMLNLKEDRLERIGLNPRGIFLMCGLALLLFALHIFEIWVFAAFYLLVGALHDLEEALYFSASCYATLGPTVGHFSQQWRLIGGVEALIGFVLIGWSTAFIVTRFEKLRE